MAVCCVDSAELIPSTPTSPILAFLRTLKHFLPQPAIGGFQSTKVPIMDLVLLCERANFLSLSAQATSDISHRLKVYGRSSLVRLCEYWSRPEDEMKMADAQG